MIEPAVIDLVLSALPDPVALVESTVRRGRAQHRLQWANPAFSSLATVPHSGADVGELGLGAAGEVISNLLDTGVAGNADSFAAYRKGANVAVRISVHPLAEQDGPRRSVVVVRERSEEPRGLLWEALQDDLARPEPAVAVLFVDLDDFKFANDSFGHETGDDLLLAVAGRLTDTVRPQDLVTRCGGGQFVVVCADVRDPAQAEGIAGRLVGALVPPFTIAGREISVSASMGLVLSTESLFDERVRQGVTTRLAMANALRRAIEHDQLTVHYQPIVDQVTGRAVGVEALSRWYDSEFGNVSPTVFVTLAEEMGIIGRLGEWVLRTACRQFATWEADLGDFAPAYLSVNLSARQLAGPGMVETVMATLEATGLPPRRLCLELTESVFMGEIEGAVGQLRDLCSLGVRLAMDDFGTGYSSLSSLRRFPGEFLKIDRSFVAALRTDPTAPAIVAAVVSLSEALGLSPVAEGVEAAEDAELLRALGCRFAQGYLYARPMPEAEATTWLQAPVGARPAGQIPRSGA